MSWPRDEAKLARVRALMAEEDLDALVVRAPDNVLYLTNFWGMKGYDACVFPREGDPTLICLEASAEDAARTAWTDDVRLFHGYDETDPRPVTARTLEAAVDAARGYGRVGLELSLGTQASDRMVGEPTTFTRAWFDAFPAASDATPLLGRARMRKTPQEVERMRLANELAAAAMDHVRERLHVFMKESEAAALWQGYVHGVGTGWRGKVELALPFSLVWAGRGIKTFTATGDLPVQEGEPVLFEIWVCVDGYWADHTKNLVLGELRDDYRELSSSLWRSMRARSTTAGPVRASPSSTASSVTASRRPATPGSPRIRSATASARARTSRRTRTRPAAARSRRGWCSRSSPASTGTAAAVCASRTTSSSPRRAPRSCRRSRTVS